MPLVFHESFQADFNNYCVQQYPKEACGLLIGGRFYPVENVSPEPNTNFEMKASELGMLELTVGKIEAILHSHPYTRNTTLDYKPEWPSHRDMEQWMAWGVPWGIVATDGKGISKVMWLDDNNRAPLNNRTFEHGITDCYSLVRDYYKMEKGIDIPNFARGWKWWEKGQNLYLDNFAAAGFVQIPRKEAKAGDGIIYKIHSPTPNHAAVLVSDTMILHHPFRRNSEYRMRSDWARLEYMTVRYKL